MLSTLLYLQRPRFAHCFTVSLTSSYGHRLHHQQYKVSESCYRLYHDSARTINALNRLHTRKSLLAAGIGCLQSTSKSALFASLSKNSQNEKSNNKNDLTNSNEGDDDSNAIPLKAGDEIQVEVVSFGPLGASVEIVACSHNPEDVIPADQPAFAKGLILQREIAYFRQARRNVDVVVGEILPAYVERVRLETNRVDVILRAYGGRKKADQVAERILQLLDQSPISSIPVGDKSSAQEIAALFPGVSKSSFKRAVSSLYKEGKVVPSPDKVTKTIT